jgi:hypothetical protein
LPDVDEDERLDDAVFAVVVVTLELGIEGLNQDLVRDGFLDDGVVLEQVVAAVFKAFDLGKGKCFGGDLDILVFVIGLFTIVLLLLFVVV